MKIINERHEHINKTIDIQCNNCKSDLQYNKEDIKYDFERNSYYYYIECPVCYQRLYLKS